MKLTFLSGGPLIRGKAEITSDYMDTAYSALTGLNAIIGLFSSLAVNMPDFGRFSKNNLAEPHQFLALPIIGTLGALTPIFVTDAHSYLWGEFSLSVIYALHVQLNRIRIGQHPCRFSLAVRPRIDPNHESQSISNLAE